MKRLIGFVVIFIFTIIAGWNIATAAVVAPSNQLRIVDLNDDGNLTFDISFFQSGGAPWEIGYLSGSGFELFSGSYFTGGSTTQFNGSATIADGTILDIALRNGTDILALSDGIHDLNWVGEIYPGIYDGFNILWDTSSLPTPSFTVTVSNAANNDGGFSAVPIPTTALLFFSSIIGIIGIRRKLLK